MPEIHLREMIDIRDSLDLVFVNDRERGYRGADGLEVLRNTDRERISA